MSEPALNCIKMGSLCYRDSGEDVREEIYSRMDSVKTLYIPSNNCLLSHCCSSQLREKVVCLYEKTYLPGFDTTAAVSNYILWNVTKSGV